MDRTRVPASKHPSAPPNYLSRRVQYRLMVLVALFMTTILMMVEARKPENWRWMWRGQPSDLSGEGTSDREEGAGDARKDAKRTELDTRLRLQRDLNPAGPPDTFIAQRNLEDPVPERAKQDGLRLFPSVNITQLERIEDDRVLRGAERQAWFHLLDILKNTDRTTLENASVGQVGFLQIFEQPQSYRGRLVDVRGTVHSAEWVKAPANENGIDGYTTCWVRPAGANSPINVYVLELPNGFPTGSDLREEVRLTGFFFKRLAYAANDGSRTAPLLLAKSARWTPPETKSRKTFDAMPTGGLGVPIAISILGSSIIAVSVALAVYWSSRRARPSQAFTAVSRTTPEQMDRLADEEITPSPSEFLRTLEDDGRSEE